MLQLPPAQKVKAADDADVYLHDKCLFFVFFLCRLGVLCPCNPDYVFFCCSQKLNKRINFQQKIKTFGSQARIVTWE